MRPAQGGHVYFLVMKNSRESGDRDLVKVGITSNDVVDRVATLQTGNPYDLRCFDSFQTPWPREVERFIHRTHAPDMQQNEWMRWNLDDLQALVNEAKDAARQIEGRKLREQGYVAQPSNGQKRRATPNELALRTKAQELLTQRVPTVLRLKATENRLKAATGGTMGIPGIVRASFIEATKQFCPQLARSHFADLTAQCSVNAISGKFRWLGRPQRRCFISEYASAKQAAAAARRSVGELLLSGTVTLNGWTDRTRATELWHDDFLDQTRTVHQLDAKLADIQTELTLVLREYEAIEGLCSFKRLSVPKIDAVAFYERVRERYHDTYAAQCERFERPRAPQIRKCVYTTRSYL